MKSEPLKEHLSLELTQPVEPDKFDRHMCEARRNDIQSRRKIFIRQNDVNQQFTERVDAITPSIY